MVRLNSTDEPCFHNWKTAKDNALIEYCEECGITSINQVNKFI
jgi:hypothetical protein